MTGHQQGSMEWRRAASRLYEGVKFVFRPGSGTSLDAFLTSFLCDLIRVTTSDFDRFRVISTNFADARARPSHPSLRPPPSFGILNSTFLISLMCISCAQARILCAWGREKCALRGGYMRLCAPISRANTLTLTKVMKCWPAPGFHLKGVNGNGMIAAISA